MTDKTYIAVFFDVDLPALPQEARQIQLDKKRFKALMDEAQPGKIVELTDRYGIVGEYKVISRRLFQLKAPDIDFIIFDIKEKSSAVSELTKWLSEQKGLESINKLFYRFFYNEKWCAGKVTVTSEYEELRIMPNLNTHDIGNGPGAPVDKKFKRLK